jgi:hypothetical protein
MRIKNKPSPSSKITFKTSDQSGSMVLNRWYETKNSAKSAMEMITTAAYLKENTAYRYRQAAIYARLYGNQSLYSFAGANISKFDQNNGLPQERPTFNLISSCTDTLVSRITQSRPQPTFLTDGGDYKQRNLAKKLNNFIQGEFYHTDAYKHATTVLRDSCIQGTGCAHVFETDDNRVGLERVLLTELLTDSAEGIYGDPRRLYRMKLVDRAVLLACYPDKEDIIKIAVKATPDNGPDASKTVADQIMVVEAWSLPSSKHSKDGRHMMGISSGCLLDEAYDKPRFPFAFLHYAPRQLGFWSQGLAERLMGTQIELNSILYTISRAIKLVGVPRVFQEDGSKVVAAHHNNEIGVIVKYRGTKPSYEVAPCNAPELYQERDKLISYGYQSEGISSMQASAQKPQGLDSGEAIRSYDDISTDRFATIARRYDDFFIDLAYLMIDTAKDIALEQGSYSTVYPAKDGTKTIDLPKAAIESEDAFIIQCFTQSSLPKDPAGRLAKVTEMIQAGMISIQEGRRLLDYPDLEQVEKLANAGEERIFQILDDIIENGKYTPPDPFMDLDLAMKLTVQYINLYSQAKLEESKADMLRNFFNQINMIKQSAQPPAMPPQAPNTPQAAPMPQKQSPLVPNGNVPQPA